MKRRQDAPVRLRGERTGMAETGQSLMDLGGAEGEGLFNRTMRTEKERVAAKKAEVAARKGVDSQENPVGENDEVLKIIRAVYAATGGKGMVVYNRGGKRHTQSRTA